MNAVGKALLVQIRQRLYAMGDAGIAKGADRFFPADQASPRYGVKAVPVRQLATEASLEVRNWSLAERNFLCDQLWGSRMAEEGTLAIDLYRRFARQFGPAEFHLFEQWLERYVNNWAHCDGISCNLIRAVLARHPDMAADLLGWTASTNRWKRRAAAASLVHEVRSNRHLELAYEVCDRLRPDEDDMIRKAVGWLLKNAYERSPKPTMSFLLAPGRPPFAPIVKRIIAEKMSAADLDRINLRKA